MQAFGPQSSLPTTINITMASYSYSSIRLSLALILIIAGSVTSMATCFSQHTDVCLSDVSFTLLASPDTTKEECEDTFVGLSKTQKMKDCFRSIPVTCEGYQRAWIDDVVTLVEYAEQRCGFVPTPVETTLPSARL